MTRRIPLAHWSRSAGSWAVAALLGVAFVATLLPAAGCGRKVSAPAPAALLPPSVVQVMPAARSTGILDDTPIWAEFENPLDASTVSTTSVFLKVDTRRLPISVWLEDGGKRIRIVPLVPLALFVTHTIELGPGIASADGATLGSTFFWQFRVASVRRPRAPFPLSGVAGESPLLGLSWIGTEAGAGTIAYDLWTGADSAAVAGRAAPPLARVVVRTSFIPTARWDLGTTVWWTVRATNLTTGESLDGPVWRFATLPADTPIDSVLVPARDWFYGYTTGSTYNRRCLTDSILSGVAIDQDYLRWSWTGFGPGVRLAGATMELSPWPSYALRVPSFLAVGGVDAGVGTVCITGATSPFVKPVQGGTLALGEVIPGPRIRFASDAFAAYLEHSIRSNGPEGVCFSANSRFGYVSPLITFLPLSPPPSLKLYVYRPAAAFAHSSVSP